MGPSGRVSPSLAAHPPKPTLQQTPSPRASLNTPTTLYLARSSSLDDLAAPPPHDSTKTSPQDSRFGVESLASSTDSTPPDQPAASPLSSAIDDSPAALPRQLSRSSIGQPLTPLFIPSPAAGSSMPGSAKSFSTRSFRQLSDEGSLGEEGGVLGVEELGGGVTDSHPLLVMPSIKMPARRPFTEGGKAMGRLKVLVAGREGTGKSSLIRSILQTCEDIVHVDQMSLQSQAQKRNGKAHDSGSVKFCEIYASTKPYPSWWTDLGETLESSKRRGSLGDTVLERNICFVDTQCSSESEAADICSATETYVTSCMRKSINTADMNRGELLELLNGNGGPLVDVVLYLIDGEVSSEDTQYLSRLAPLTNLVPLIARCDTLTDNELDEVKTKITTALDEIKIPCLSLNEIDIQPPPLFAVTSATIDDSETMDASLLMSPDYIQPLRPSDLPSLVSTIFPAESISHIRHLTTQKLLSWWEHTQPAVKPHSTPSLALARTENHQRREDRFAQVRLARWATELQRSLQNERRRYETLARGERAVWLTERLGECVIDGSLVPNPPAAAAGRSSPDAALTMVTTTTAATASQRRKPGGVRKASLSPGKFHNPNALINPSDPLGLLGCSEDVKRLGWVLCRIAGSFGILGGVVVFLARARGVTLESAMRWVLDSEVGFWVGRGGGID